MTSQDSPSPRKWGPGPVRRNQLRATLASALAAPPTAEAVHLLIAALLTSGIRAFDRAAVADAIRLHPKLVGLPLKHRMMEQQYLFSCAALYYRLFAPPLNWTYEGSEVLLEGIPVDHLWRPARGRYVIDELKTGRRSGDLYPEIVNAQLERQLDAGQQSFGSRFNGVRVLVFSQPNRSFLAYPGGRYESLFERSDV